MSFRGEFGLNSIHVFLVLIFSFSVASVRAAEPGTVSFLLFKHEPLKSLIIQFDWSGSNRLQKIKSRWVACASIDEDRYACQLKVENGQFSSLGMLSADQLMAPSEPGRYPAAASFWDSEDRLKFRIKGEPADAMFQVLFGDANEKSEVEESPVHCFKRRYRYGGFKLRGVTKPILTCEFYILKGSGEIIRAD